MSEEVVKVKQMLEVQNRLNLSFHEMFRLQDEQIRQITKGLQILENAVAQLENRVNGFMN